MNFPRHTQSQKSENETKLSAVPGNGAHLTSFVISTKTTKEGKNLENHAIHPPKAAAKKLFLLSARFPSNFSPLSLGTIINHWRQQESNARRTSTKSKHIFPVSRVEKCENYYHKHSGS